MPSILDLLKALGVRREFNDVGPSYVYDSSGNIVRTSGSPSRGRLPMEDLPARSLGGQYNLGQPVMSTGQIRRSGYTDQPPVAGINLMQAPPRPAPAAPPPAAGPSIEELAMLGALMRERADNPVTVLPVWRDFPPDQMSALDVQSSVREAEPTMPAWQEPGTFGDAALYAQLSREGGTPSPVADNVPGLLEVAADGVDVSGDSAPAEPPAAAPKAKTYTWRDIAAANPQVKNPNRLRVGQKLTMPDGEVYVVQPGDTMVSIAKRLNFMTRAGE